MDIVQGSAEPNQSNGSGPDVLTKTKIDVKLRTAVLAVAGLALLAAAGIGITKIVKSGNLSIYRDYDSPPAGTILYAYDNSQHTLFSAGIWVSKEDVKISRVEFTFLADKNFKGNLKDMIKNLTLYRKVYNYGYGYGYNYSLEPVAKLSSLTGSGGRALAKFEFSPLLFLANNTSAFVVVGEIPASAPEGNFSVQIANSGSVSAVGAQSNRRVTANVSYAKGDWLTVKKAPTIKVVSPNGGEKWEAGKTYDIKWQVDNDSGDNVKGGPVVTISLIKKSDKGFNLWLFLQVLIGQGSYTNSWQVPNDLVPGDDYLIKIDGNVQADLSDAPFSIIGGQLSLAKYTGYPDQNLTAPKRAVKLGDWRLTNGTGQSATLTALEPDWDGSEGSNIGRDIYNCYFEYGEKRSLVKSGVSSTTDSYSISYSLTDGATIPVELYCDVAASISGSTRADLTVRGKNAVNGLNVDSVEVAGQIIKWGSGKLSAQVVDSDPIDRTVYSDGTNQVIAANYRITATNEAFTISQLGFKFIDPYNASVVKSVRLFDGATELTSPVGTIVDSRGYATTTGLNWQIPANATKTLTVKLELQPVGTNNAPSGLDAAVTLNSLQAISNSTGLVSTVNPTPAQGRGNAVIVYKGYPVITHIQLSESERRITNDAQSWIYKFKITPTGSSVALKQFKLKLAWSDTTYPAALELESVRLFRGITDLANVITVVDQDGNSIEGSSGVLENDNTMVFAFIDEEQIAAETIYTIKATPRNFDSGTTSQDSVTLYIDGDNSQITSQDNRLVIDPDGNNIWALGRSTAQGAVGIEANLIWSDMNQTPHAGVAGNSSADWFNGYLIRNLPLDPVTMRK